MTALITSSFKVRFGEWNRLSRSLNIIRCSQFSTSPTILTSKHITQSKKEDIIGKSVRVQGWIRTVRNQKKIVFMEVNDGSTLAGLQVICDSGSSAFNDAEKLVKFSIELIIAVYYLVLAG